MDIKKIIWPSDMSGESDKSLGYARYIAKRYNSEILGVHVTHIESSLSHLDIFEMNRKPLENARVRTEKSFEDYFRSVGARLAKEGIQFSGKIVLGKPGAKIINLTKSEGADLVVMGTRGHGLLNRLLIGSTTLSVLRSSRVPVLAYKKTEKKSATIKHLLVPVDLHEEENSALDYAMGLAGRLDARITVIYVIRMVGAVYAMPTILKSMLVGSSREIVKRVEEMKLKHKADIDHSRLKTKVLHGLNPAVAITDYASAKKVDLIVINTHSRKGIKKQLLGSVTEKVIQISDCSVLAIRP